MTARKYGYVRISSKEQNTDRQIQALADQGVDERDIYIDKQSGKDFDRPNYKLLKHNIRKGDTLYIKSLDRFGRNYTEIKQQWQEITQTIGADIEVLDMPILNTKQHKDLLGNFVSNIVLEILGFVAENERNNIKQRQREGIEIAKVKGKHLGRPRAEYPEQWTSVYADWKQGKITAVQAFNTLGMKKATFYKLVKQHEEAGE